MQVLCNARVILTVVVCFYLHFFADAKFKCTITVYKHPPGNSCEILIIEGIIGGGGICIMII
jgi:hypothetical protein